MFPVSPARSLVPCFSRFVASRGAFVQSWPSDGVVLRARRGASTSRACNFDIFRCPGRAGGRLRRPPAAAPAAAFGGRQRTEPALRRGKALPRACPSPPRPRPPPPPTPRTSHPTMQGSFGFSCFRRRSTSPSMLNTLRWPPLEPWLKCHSLPLKWMSSASEIRVSARCSGGAL